MTKAQQLLSLLLLGASAFALAPAASANSDDTRMLIRQELRECRELHSGDRDAMKACAQEVFTSHGIEKPAMRKHRKRGRHIRVNIEETCGEREDTDQWKQCALDARQTARENMQEHRTNLREQLASCLQETEIGALKTCVQNVHSQMKPKQQ